MEGLVEKLPPAIRTRCHRSPPSFSSSLLDAIYRSIGDEEDSYAVTRPHYCYNQKPVDHRRTTRKPVIGSTGYETAGAVNTPPSLRRTATVSQKPRNRFSAAAVTRSSSSSDGSSNCNSFSCHPEPESNTLTTTIMPRLKPLRTGTKPVGSNHVSSKEKTTKSSKPPPSPGARIAGFISSLLSAATPKKKKRSSMNKVETEEMKQRSFRLAEDERNIGDYEELRRRGFHRRCTTISAVEKMVRSRVEKLMFAMEEEEDRDNQNKFEEEETGSDTSSDLFELENLDIISTTKIDHQRALGVIG